MHISFFLSPSLPPSFRNDDDFANSYFDINFIYYHDNYNRTDPHRLTSRTI